MSICRRAPHDFFVSGSSCLVDVGRTLNFGEVSCGSGSRSGRSLVVAFRKGVAFLVHGWGAHPNKHPSKKSPFPNSSFRLSPCSSSVGRVYLRLEKQSPLSAKLVVTYDRCSVNKRRHLPRGGLFRHFQTTRQRHTPTRARTGE